MPPRRSAKAQKAEDKREAKAQKAIPKAVTPKAGRTLLEQEAASSSASNRGRKPTDTDRAIVTKIMNGHFRGLTTDEKFVVTVSGQTLEDTLTEYRAAWLRGDITLGKNYYCDLRRASASEETPLKMIQSRCCYGSPGRRCRTKRPERPS